MNQIKVSLEPAAIEGKLRQMLEMAWPANN